MSKVVNSVCKFCRRENQKLFLKGSRCFTDKCSFDRRSYPPGQHGQSRLKFSEYALQLREKQKTKRFYGLLERQFFKFFKKADSGKGVTGLNFLQSLEMRLDSVVYTLGFAVSRKEARQVVGHRHVKVNGKQVNIPSFVCKVGDVIEIAPSIRESARMLNAVQMAATRETPSWLEVDHKAFTGKVKGLPGREQISLPVEENMIVEYYSR